jgi:hypothetical protein
MITAAIPTYNNAAILWLQLESLCNQVDAPEWELIMCEEESDNTFGSEELRKWHDRLKAANCQRIIYLHLLDWIPLGQKWMIIRDNMSPESVGMMLCASDNYSPNNRIRKSYDAMVNGADWSQFESGHFYNILDHKAGLFSAPEGNPALFMCISKDRVNNITQSVFPRKGVDSWMLKTSGANITNLGYTDGIHTDGYNTISHKRRNLYDGEGFGLFTKADENEVFGMFPKYIQEKLLKMRL